MKLNFPFCALLIAVFSSAGVVAAAPAKEIPLVQRKQAATLVSEAQFAINMRDFARAERVLTEATGLCPDIGEYWATLGTVRVRLGQRDSAKRAYETAFSTFEQLSKNKPQDIQPLLLQLDVLALLGRKDEARAQLARLKTKYAQDRQLQVYVDSDRLENLIRSPKFKEIAL